MNCAFFKESFLSLGRLFIAPIDTASFKPESLDFEIQMTLTTIK